MDGKQQIHLWYFMVAFLDLLLVQSWLSQASVTERIPDSTFLDAGGAFRPANRGRPPRQDRPRGYPAGASAQGEGRS